MGLPNEELDALDDCECGGSVWHDRDVCRMRRQSAREDALDRMRDEEWDRERDPHEADAPPL